MVDVIITEKCVFQVDSSKGLVLTEIAEGYTAEDIKKCTGCPIEVSGAYCEGLLIELGLLSGFVGRQADATGPNLTQSDEISAIALHIHLREYIAYSLVTDISLFLIVLRRSSSVIWVHDENKVNS